MAHNTVNDKYIFVIAKANLLSAQKTLYKFSKSDFKQTLNIFKYVDYRKYPSKDMTVTNNICSTTILILS